MKLNSIDRLIIAVLLLIPLVVACVGVVIVSIKGSIRMVTMDRMLEFGGFPACAGLFALTKESGWFLIPAFLLFAFIFGWCLSSLRCPTCGWRVHLKHLGGPGAVSTNPHQGDYYIGFFMAKRCFECGADLTQVQFDWKMFHWNWRPSHPHPNFPYPKLW